MDENTTERTVTATIEPETREQVEALSVPEQAASLRRMLVGIVDDALAEHDIKALVDAISAHLLGTADEMLNNSYSKYGWMAGLYDILIYVERLRALMSNENDPKLRERLEDYALASAQATASNNLKVAQGEGAYAHGLQWALVLREWLLEDKRDTTKVVKSLNETIEVFEAVIEALESAAQTIKQKLGGGEAK